MCHQAAFIGMNKAPSVLFWYPCPLYPIRTENSMKKCPGSSWRFWELAVCLCNKTTYSITGRAQIMTVKWIIWGGLRLLKIMHPLFYSGFFHNVGLSNLFGPKFIKWHCNYAATAKAGFRVNAQRTKVVRFVKVFFSSSICRQWSSRSRQPPYQ